VSAFISVSLEDIVSVVANSLKKLEVLFRKARLGKEARNHTLKGIQAVTLIGGIATSLIDRAKLDIKVSSLNENLGVLTSYKSIASGIDHSVPSVIILLH